MYLSVVTPHEESENNKPLETLEPSSQTSSHERLLANTLFGEVLQ